MALILSDQWPEKAGKGLMIISLNVEPETHQAERCDAIAPVAVLDWNAARFELGAQRVQAARG